MRRIFVALVGAVVLFVSASTAFAEGAFHLVVNGAPLTGEAKPFWNQTYAMVPVRATFEAMGYQIQYDSAQKRIDLTSQLLSAKHINLWVGRRTVTVNGNEFQLTTEVVERDGHAYVPADLFDDLKFWAKWDENTETLQVFWSLPEETTNRLLQATQVATTRLMMFKLITLSGEAIHIP